MKELSRVPGPPEIHRAEWVVPVSTPPLCNGAVLTHAGRVVDVGPYTSMRRNSPAGARLVDHGQTALFPALVNAHTHLELSALRDKIPFPQPGFREWIEFLLAARPTPAPPTCIDESLRIGMAELISCGTALCADITNGSAAREPGPPANLADPALRSASQAGFGESCDSFAASERLVFLELLGFNLNSIAAAMPPWLSTHETATVNPAYGPTAIPVPHSAYSVSPAIISESKEWTRARRLPFSIHVAEHLDEIEFLRSGTGFCRELLHRVGRWDRSWKPPGKTPAEYLDGLGALDFRTLLVHAVHMTEADWALAAKRQCKVVFCPRSNRNLGSGRPWIEKAISLGMSCALGTDSLASNTDLNLFSEAGFTLDEHPSIDPKRVLEMITANPARSLGRQSDYGSIEPGGKPIYWQLKSDMMSKNRTWRKLLFNQGKEGHGNG